MKREKYKAESNQHLRVIDLRDPEWRKEKFIRHLKWRSWAKELDDAHWNSAFLNSKLRGDPLTLGQKVWFSLLYGLTYSPGLAWTFLWYFPHVEHIDQEELKFWLADNKANLIWKHEARHTRQHVPRIFEEIRLWANGSLEKKIHEYLDGNKHENFNKIFKDLTDNVHGFGRFAAWTGIQCLVESVGLNMEPDTMFIDGSSSTKNQWNGICQFDGMPQYLPEKGTSTFMDLVPKEPWTPSVIKKISDRSRELLEELKGNLPEVPLTMLNLESMLCEWSYDFTDFHPGIHGIDVMGVYPKFVLAFPKVDYSPMKGAIDEIPSVIRAFEPVFPKIWPIDTSGQVMFMHELFPDMPNMFDEIGLQPEFFRMKEEDGAYVINGDREKRLVVSTKAFRDYGTWWNTRSLFD